MPKGDRDSGNLAVAYRVADRDMISLVDVQVDAPARRIREVSWTSDIGPISGLAAMPTNRSEPTFAIVERGNEGQNFMRISTMPGSQPVLAPAFAWPNIRDRAVWVTSAR
jgi:hypothetical protein